MSFKNETVAETKSCQKCQVSFDVTDKDLEFYEKVSPVFNDKKFQIPAPTLCPDCRTKRRFCWRNERSLYMRECDYSKQPVISMFAPSSKYRVYKPDIWWSDDWNPLDYGRDFDFERPFFDQYGELYGDIPKMATDVNAVDNSDYTNCVGMARDCYMIFASGTNQNCYYGNNLERSKKCMDCYLIFDCENCYELSASFGCHSMRYGLDCHDCSDSSFLIDCKGCHHCFGCDRLVNKSYCIFNKQYDKQEYEKIIKEKYSSLTLEESEDIYKKIFKQYRSKPMKSIVGNTLSNCSGDDIYNCENCTGCYNMENCQDCKYTSQCRNTKQSMDFDIFGDTGELCYESMCVGYKSYKVLFSSNCINDVNNIYYSDSCFGSSNLFGCVGLRNKSYCIFNKQYSKQEYETLVPKIIEHMQGSGEWGEFFPASLSPFGYNETLVHTYFPTTKETAIAEGFNWLDYDAPKPDVAKIILASQLPDDIVDVPDDILDWAIECEKMKKLFRIIDRELEFYRKHHLPIPKRHPDQRHLDRLAMRNSRTLFERNCDKCGITMQTTYSPGGPETVYCEECYTKEIY